MIAGILKQIQGRRVLHRVIGNTVWQVIDKVLRLGVGLIVGVWVARYLGPANFGALNYAIAFVALFSAIADGGMQAVIVRELVHRKANRSTIIWSALTLRITGAFLAILLATTSIHILRPGDTTTLVLIIIIAFSMIPQAWDVIDYDYQSRMHYRPIVITRAVIFVLTSVFRLALIFARARLVWFAWAVVGESLLSAIAMSMLPEARIYLRRSAEISWNEMRFLIRTCWPLTIAGLSVILYMRIDQVMLGQMLGDSAVGMFSAAVRVSESWYFVPLAVSSAIAPALLITKQQSEELYRQKLLSATKLVCWLSVSVAVAFSFGSKLIIGSLYGPSYASAAQVLVVHAWAGVFVSLGVAAGPWFVNAGLLRLKMAQTLTGAVVNITMNLYMIPHLGVVGAAYSTLISYAISAVVFNYFSTRTRPMFHIQLRAFLP